MEEKHEHHDKHEHHQEEVTIEINTVKRKVHTGRYSVAQIKELGGVPLADDLEILIHKKLEPLPDDGFVEIHHHEVFKSHPKGGAAS